MKKKLNVYVPDTSALINHTVSELIKKKKIKEKSVIIIPKFVLSELENQANKGKEIGYLGLEEIKRLKELERENSLEVKFEGRLPTMEEIQLSKSGRIDFLIREIAYEKNATLITCDYVQAKVAEAMAMNVIYVEKTIPEEELPFEKFFDEETSSVHLKEKCKPLAKKGKPGNVKLVEIDSKILEREDLERMINNILDFVRLDDRSYVEMNKYDAMVIQLREYRIAITRPNFSDSIEITIVRPSIKLNLEDYKLKDKLMERLKTKAEGIIIAGPPGHGKTTFAQALAEFYLKMNRVVKTMEHPRDLNLPKEITQYSPLDGKMENTADIMLLVRPDNVIYDEVRKTSDFKIFADMRMAGIGMIGVVHASKAIEAIQRFIGRVDLGLIPQIVDTVIFIYAGKVEKVYELNLTVRTPTGMTEDDLARPIIEVRDFETGELEYEIYTYGEQTVVMPVKEMLSTEKKESAIEILAKEVIEEELKKFTKHPEIEIIGKNRIVVKVSEKDIPRIIGKKGKTISELENRLGLKISVVPKEGTLRKPIAYNLNEKGAYIMILVDEEHKGKTVDLYDDEDYLISPTVSKKGYIKIKKKSEIGKKVISAHIKGRLKIYG